MRAWIAPVVLLSACGSEIGDECVINVDCSPDGDRLCDSNMPGGYCTIAGCDEGTCPEEAVCIRFFPVSSLWRTCEAGCTVDDVCLSDGFCAPRRQETRYCMRACARDYQCRGGYVCRETGMAGAELAQSPDDPAAFDPDRVGRFCGPPLNFR
jgi:hypothetical protein